MNRNKGVVLAILSLAAAPAAGQPLAPAGAAACSGCHSPTGAQNAAVPPILGRTPGDIVAAMQDFRTGKRSATVMDRIAKGFSDDEIRAIAAWLGAQRQGERP